MRAKRRSMIHDDPRLRERAPAFRDRAAAGRALAALLAPLARSGALVLAIPSGGVPVAVEVARELELELDVMPVSKILLPWTTESGFGAVASDGTVWVDEAAVRGYGLGEREVQESIAAARAKVERRVFRLRGGRAVPVLSDRSAILVDDGIAAGSTMRVAIKAVRRQGATRIVVGVPTAHARAAELLAGMAHELYCANIRSSRRFAVADAYENWHDVSEEEAESLLRKHPKGIV